MTLKPSTLIALVYTLMVVATQAAINVTVGNFGSSSGGAFFGRTWTPTESGSKIAISDLVAQLQAGTVTITTTGSLPEEGDITISAPLDLNLLPAGSTRTLVLQARDDISITGAISDSNLATGQNLNLSLNASLTTNHGDVSVGALLALGAGNVSIIGHDFSKTAGINLTTAGGDIDIAVDGGINVAGGTISTGGGNLRISGDSGGSFNSNVITAGGSFALDITESAGVSLGGVTINTSGGSGDGSVSINAYAGGVTISGGAQITSGSRGSVAMFAGSSTADLVVNGTLIAGTGGVSLRAHDDVRIGGAITSVGPVIVRADVDRSGLGDAIIDAPVTSTGGRIDVEGVMVTTTVNGTLDTSSAGANGTISISGRDGLNLAGNITAGGILQLNPGSDGDGIGQQTVTASLVSIGGNITIQGTGTLNQPIDSNGGNIYIPATGTLTLNGQITSDGGNISINGSGPGNIILGASGSLDARGGSGSGSVTLVNDGSILTQAGSTIFSGPLGGVSLTAQGVPGDIELASPIVAGTLGVTLTADGNVDIKASITSAGTVILHANHDGLNGGNLIIDATVTTTSGDVIIRGVDVAINEKITTPGKIIFEHTGTATVQAFLDGHIELRSGVVNLAAGTIRLDRNVVVKTGATLTFSSPNVLLGSSSFTQEAGSNLIMKLAGTASNQHNRIVTGPFTMGGKLTLVPEAGFTLGAGQAFDLFDFTSCTGTYATLDLPTLAPTLMWDTSALKTTGVVRIAYQPITSPGTPISVPIPGDGVINQPINSNGGGITIPGGGTPLVINGPVTSGGGSINVTQPGPGSITVGVGTTINAGGGNGTGSVSLVNDNGNVVTLPGSSLVSGTTGSVNIRADGVPGDIDSGGTITAGTGGASLIADGNVTITGNITSQGPTTLVADADGSGQGKLTVDATIVSKGNVTLQGAEIEVLKPITVEFPAKLIIDTTGTAIIRAPITGNVEIKNGTILAGNGTLGNNGSVTVLSPAALGFINPGDVITPASFSIQDGAELIINIAGPNSGQYNRVASTGPMSLGGKLTVKLLNGYVPTNGANFDILDFTSVTGDFSIYNLAQLPAGVVWDTRSLRIDGALKVISTPPADSKVVATPRNSPVTVALTAGGLNNISFTLVSSPSNGTLTGTHPNLTYTPSTDFVGDDSFSYRVSAPANSPVATVTLKVLLPLSPLPGGLYAGLIVGPDFARSGSFTFTFQLNGGVAGTITYGEQSYGFSGTFNAQGKLTATIQRSGGQSPLTVIIERTTAAGNTIYTGRVADGNSLSAFESAAEGLIIDIGGPNFGQYDRLNYNGPAAFTGPLTVNLINGYAPTAGAIFDVLDFTSVAGDFSPIQLPALPSGLMWDSRLLKIDGTLRVMNIPNADSKTILTSKNRAVTLPLTAGGLNSIGFTVTAMPQFGALGGTLPNLTYTPTTDFVGDDTLSYRVSSMPSAPAGTITIRVLPGIPPVDGNTLYTGLVSGPDFFTSGSFSFGLSGDNVINGRLIYGSESYQFSGTFVGNVATILIPRTGGRPPLTLVLERAITGGVTSITGRITGDGYTSIFEIGGNELLINIWGPNSGQYNRLNYNGAAALAGDLRVALLGGYQPTAGSIYDVLDFTTVSGDFSNLHLPALGTGLLWDTRYLKTDGTLRVIGTPGADSKVITTAINTPVSVQLTGAGLGSLPFNVTSQPNFGTLTGTLPNLTYTPGNNFTGEDAFTYTVTSAPPGTPSGTVTLRVQPTLTSGGSNTYTGIIAGPDFDRSGSFTFTVSGNAVSGRIIYGTQSLPFSGSFDANGQLTLNLIRTGGLPPLTLILNRSGTTPNFSYSGRIVDGTTVVVLTGGGGTPPGGTGFLSLGRFTFHITPNPSDGASAPQGTGFATGFVTSRGRINLSGLMPDGAFFSTSNVVLSNGSWPVFIRLYGGRGAFQASAQFTDNNSLVLTNANHWKPAGIKWSPSNASVFKRQNQVYGGGFTTSPTLSGYRYIRPVAPSLIVQPSTLNGGVLQAQFVGGNLPSTVNIPVFLDYRNRAIVNGFNSINFTLSFNMSYGLGSGYITHPVSGLKTYFRGAVDQRSNQMKGTFLGLNQAGAWTFGVPQ